MIDRRSVMIGFCGLIAMPAVIRAATSSLSSNGAPNIDLVADPKVDTVVFTIHGWNEGGRREEAEAAGQCVVSFHLASTWRASWF